jgi:SAM-dependent methyltransferase
VTFKDHFSDRAALYAACRPHYPAPLFDFVAGLSSVRDLAVDFGTGSGQAARALVDHFDRVIGMDPSAAQIAHAARHERIEYRIGRAESSGLPSRSANLVTAAQALHWFEPEVFFREAKRLLMPGGAIAVWGYGDPILDDPHLQRKLHDFNRELLEPYWLPERKILLEGYGSISFPFEEVAPPSIDLRMRWTLSELAGYLRTWSATSEFVAKRGFDPVVDVEKSLAEDWGDPRMQRVIEWPLYIRAGKTSV